MIFFTAISITSRAWKRNSLAFTFYMCYSTTNAFFGRYLLSRYLYYYSTTSFGRTLNRSRRPWCTLGPPDRPWEAEQPPRVARNASCTPFHVSSGFSSVFNFCFQWVNGNRTAVSYPDFVVLLTRALNSCSYVISNKAQKAHSLIEVTELPHPMALLIVTHNPKVNIKCWIIGQWSQFHTTSNLLQILYT